MVSARRKKRAKWTEKDDGQVKRRKKKKQEKEIERTIGRGTRGNSRRDIHPDDPLLPFIVLAIPMWDTWLSSICMPGGAIIKMTSRKRKVTAALLKRNRKHEFS